MKYYDKINSVLSKPEHKALRSKTLRLSSYSPYIQFSEEQDEVTRLTFSAEEGDNDPTDEEYMDPDEEANEDLSETIAQYHDNERDKEPKQNHTLKADYKLCLSSSDEGQHKKEDHSSPHSSPDETLENEDGIEKKLSETESSLPKSEEAAISTSGSDNERDHRISNKAERTTTDTDECRDMSPPKYARIQPKSVKANLPCPVGEASELQLVATEKPSGEKATDMVVPGKSPCPTTDGILDTQEDVQTNRRDVDVEMAKTDPKKEKLGAPTESAVICGPLLVTLALGTEWK